MLFTRLSFHIIIIHHHHTATDTPKEKHIQISIHIHIIRIQDMEKYIKDNQIFVYNSE